MIADFSRKSISTMAGTVGGVVVAGLIALIFGQTAHITGYNVDDIETMVYIAQNFKIQISGILFSGIIISSLGAVMDVAMSIATSLNELNEKMPDISRKELFRSGIMNGLAGSLGIILTVPFTACITALIMKKKPGKA